MDLKEFENKIRLEIGKSIKYEDDLYSHVVEHLLFLIERDTERFMIFCELVQEACEKGLIDINELSYLMELNKKGFEGVLTKKKK